MKRKRYVSLLIAMALLAGITACSLIRPVAKSVNSVWRPQGRIVVIDAGHGGVDGGATSTDGSITESQINLQIARRLALLLLFCGEQVALTRTDESDLASPEASTIREKKVSDLKNRVTAINNTNADFLISIHQNSLPEKPSVHGAQVFYNTAPQSDALASIMQQSLNQVINPQKGKNAKPIDSSVYLMREVTCTAALVECGFLSNSTEARQLCTDIHQKNLALSIAAGYLQYVSEGIT